MDTQTIITDIKTALSIATTVASAVAAADPEAKIAGIALDKIVAVAKAAGAGSSDAADYIAKMQALAESTANPTPAQWATIDVQTDADVQRLEDSTAAGS